MEITIKEDKKDPIFERTYVKGELSFTDVTPSKDKLAKELSSRYKKDEKLIVIKFIKTYFGFTKAEFEAAVYDSEEAKENTERKTKAQKEQEKKEAEEAAKKAEEEKAKAEEAAKKAEEEKPAEEAKEEQKEAPAENKEEKPAEEAKEEKKTE